jgi:Zn-dependent protease
MSAAAGGGSAVGHVSLLLAAFGCVVLHELGHALTARQFGIGTRGITLLPIGGVASLERMPRQPLQELCIAVAGPLVNVAIAAALFFISAPLAAFSATDLLVPGSLNWLNQLFWINAVLVLFNMLPAFPMDGGRVLRSVLAMVVSHVQATRIAAGVGKIMAVLFGLAGLFSGNLILVLVAVFVFLAGSAEARLAEEQYQREVSIDNAYRSNTAWNDAPDRSGSVVVWDEQAGKYRTLGSKIPWSDGPCWHQS